MKKQVPKFDLKSLDLDSDLLDFEDEDLNLESGLSNIITDTDLKWIFVGGKGGVGKTTISSSLALMLTEKRKNVLLVSTDPAHNLSDIFLQKFNNKPQLVKGVKNLSVMEVNSELFKKKTNFSSSSVSKKLTDLIPQELLEEVGGNMPGIDEISVLLEIMKEVNSLNFDVVVFDTAPTGHTLKLLSLPTLIEKGYSKYSGLVSKIGGFFDVSENDMKESNEAISKIVAQFRDQKKTTFVCVCIPSFLSIYETERLVQALIKNEIDTHNIVVNQCIPGDNLDHCELCAARHRIQKKYIDQIDSLYNYFHRTKIPLFKNEVKGLDNLWKLKENLLKK